MSKKKAGIIAGAVLGAGLAVAAATTGVVLANQPLDVTYYANNGTPAVSSQIKKGNNAILPTPTRAGYNFAGWYTDTNLTQQVTSTTKLKQNSKLYAGWELANYEVASANVIDVKAQTAGLKSIGKYAFAGSQITSITIPDTVTSIGEGAFQGCYNLQTVTFGRGLKTINEKAFQYCYNLQSVNWGDSLETIGDYAFACTGLVSITITDAVTTIGEGAFQECYSLLEVDLGINLETIGASAFQDCVNLQNAYFGNKLKTIGASAFQGCVYLSEVMNFPLNITSVGKWAFSGCPLYLGEFRASQNSFEMWQMAIDNCTVECLYIEDEIYNSINDNTALGAFLSGAINVYVKQEIENAYYNSYFLEGYEFAYLGHIHEKDKDYICFSDPGQEMQFTITYYGYNYWDGYFSGIDAEQVRYRGTANGYNGYDAEFIIGWSRYPDNIPEDISLTDIRENLDLYACYETFTITYYDDEGNYLYEEEVLYSHSAVGYYEPEIIGWTTSFGGDPEDIDFTNITQNMELYACYQMYTVYYYDWEGNNLIYSEQVREGQSTFIYDDGVAVGWVTTPRSKYPLEDSELNQLLSDVREDIYLYAYYGD